MVKETPVVDLVNHTLSISVLWRVLWAILRFRGQRAVYRDNVTPPKQFLERHMQRLWQHEIAQSDKCRPCHVKTALTQSIRFVVFGPRARIKDATSEAFRHPLCICRPYCTLHQRSVDCCRPRVTSHCRYRSGRGLRPRQCIQLHRTGRPSRRATRFSTRLRNSRM